MERTNGGITGPGGKNVSPTYKESVPPVNGPTSKWWNGNTADQVAARNAEKKQKEFGKLWEKNRLDKTAAERTSKKK